MDDCACVYVDSDGEQAEFQSETCPVARKDHKCGECGRTIKKGERYEYASGKFDGEMYVNKTCSDCLSVRAAFFCTSYSYGEIWQDLGQHIYDLDGKISSDCLAGLTPRARERVCQIIEECWDEYEDD